MGQSELQYNTPPAIPVKTSPFSAQVSLEEILLFNMGAEDCKCASGKIYYY